jgi:hypothetical protein
MLRIWDFKKGCPADFADVFKENHGGHKGCTEETEKFLENYT